MFLSFEYVIFNTLQPTGSDRIGGKSSLKVLLLHHIQNLSAVILLQSNDISVSQPLRYTEVHPNSFVSNYWGALLSITRECILLSLINI